SRSPCWWSRSAPPSAARRDTPSTPPATSARASRTPCCRSRTRAAATGHTRGCRSSAPCSAARSAAWPPWPSDPVPGHRRPTRPPRRGPWHEPTTAHPHEGVPMTDTQKYILSIDQGTTSTRAIVFDHDGQIVSTGQKEHEQIFPKSGWVEHDPLEIWRNTRSVVGEALTGADINRHQLAAVGITNQRETAV